MVNRTCLAVLLVVVAVSIDYAVDYVRKHSKVSPTAYEFPHLAKSTIPRLTDPRLIRLDHDRDSVINFTDSYGAESFAEDPLTGDVYTGLADGRLQRLRFSFSLHGSVDTEITDLIRANLTSVGDGERCSGHQRQPAAECGRFLGLKIWHPQGENATLIACESLRGLVKIENIDDDRFPHVIQILTSHISIKDTINFCNALVMSPDGSTVYFTDSSKRRLQDFIYDVLDGKKSGRLLTYNMKTEVTSIIKDQIAFPNGVTLTHENDALLVTEMMRGIVWKYQITENQKGVWSIFCVLPFLPDNIQQRPDNKTYSVGGFFWLSPLAKSFLSSWEIIRKALGVLSPNLLNSSISRWLFEGVGVIATVNRTGDITNIVDGSRAGAIVTSEGFEPIKSPVLLWGSFRYDVPLIASKRLDLVVQRDRQDRQEKKKKSEKEEVLIEETIYGEDAVDELQLGNHFIDD